MIEIAWIGAIQDDFLDEGSDFCGISYITDEVRSVLHGLPEFSHVRMEQETDGHLEGLHVYEFIRLWQG